MARAYTHTHIHGRARDFCLIATRRRDYTVHILRTQPGAYSRCYQLGNTPRGAVLRTISTAINYVPRVFLRVWIPNDGKPKGVTRQASEKDVRRHVRGKDCRPKTQTLKKKKKKGEPSRRKRRSMKLRYARARARSRPVEIFYETHVPTSDLE